MAIATTYMTSPALRYLIRGTELEANFKISPLMQGQTINDWVSTLSASAN